MRTCNKCGLAKPETEFYASQIDQATGERKGDGLRRVCKDCTKQHQKQWFDGLTDSRKRVIKKRRVRQVGEWNKKNPLYQKAAKANLHARRLGAAGVVTGKEVIAVWRTFGGKCWCCGCDADQLDHYRPLNKVAGGKNTADNVRPICQECNQKRSHQWHGDAVARKEAALLKMIKQLLKGAAE